MPLPKNHTPLEGTERLKTFTDGFMAIVMTILVLELRVPEIAGSASSDVLKALSELAPKFLLFLASFVTVAVFWVNHHHLLYSIKKTDGKLLWYNNHMLFWISLIPFATAFIGDYPTTKLVVALYGAVMCMSAVAATLLLNHVFISSKLLDANIPASSRKTQVYRSGAGALLYALSIMTAFIHPYISYALFVLMPAYFFWPQRADDQVQIRK